MPKFSIISVYNDKKIRDEWLREGLKSEPEDLYETIFIDNRNGEYDTAPEALNAGAKEASGEYLLFVHQDVRLLTEGGSWLQKAVDHLDDISDLGIAGVCGRVENKQRGEKRERNVFYHGRPPEELEMELPPEYPHPDETLRPGREHPLYYENIVEDCPHPEIIQPFFGVPIEEPDTVQTLDELMLIVPSEVFEEHQFDEEACDGWHFYGVEYALRMKYRTNLKPYVLPLPVWHRSTGRDCFDDESFYRLLSQVAEKYSTDPFSTIYAPTGNWDLVVYNSSDRLELLWKAVKRPHIALRYLRHQEDPLKTLGRILLAKK